MWEVPSSACCAVSTLSQTLLNLPHVALCAPRVLVALSISLCLAWLLCLRRTSGCISLPTSLSSALPAHWILPVASSNGAT